MVSEKYIRVSILVLIILIAGFIACFCCPAAKGTDKEENISGNSSFLPDNETILDNLKLNLIISEPKEENITFLTDKVREKISESVSYNDYKAEDSLKEELFFILRDPKYKYNGSVKRMYDFSVRVFKTLNDPVISNPSYLSREYVIRYNISINPESGEGNREENTIWWFESDASRIAKNVYATECGNNVAVIIISYYNNQNGKTVTFVLEAKDLEKLKDYWQNDDSFIRYYDWSELITDDEGIIYYEEPSAGINIPAGDLPFESTAGLSINNENLKAVIKSQSFELMNAVDSIKRSVLAGNLEETQKLSENLIGMSKNFREEIMNYSEDELSARIINEYLKGIASISMVGSHYWSKSLIPGEIADETCDRNLLEGVEKINTVLGYFDEQGYENEAFQTPKVSLYTDYLPSGTSFHYKDNQGNNDISIRIKDYYLKEKILLKKRTNLEYQEAGLGNIYIGIVVEITHMGYRGEGTDKIKTPSLGSYSLYYNGDEYKTFNPGYYVQDMGEIYQEKTLSRREKDESLIFFEIKNENKFDPKKGYVTVDLGDYGNQIWCLSNGLESEN